MCKLQLLLCTVEFIWCWELFWSFLKWQALLCNWKRILLQSSCRLIDQSLIRALYFVLIVQLYEPVQVLNKFMSYLFSPFQHVDEELMNKLWGKHQHIARGWRLWWIDHMHQFHTWSGIEVSLLLQRHVEHVVISVEEVTETFPPVQMMVGVILKLVEVAGFEV